MALCTAKKLARELGCSPSTVYDLARRGVIPSIKLGADLVRFDLAEVIAALKNPRAEEPQIMIRKANA